ncbi:MAG: DNA-3-methyladenine glycosylase [Myxococcales bacterium FL481]|nr:MAG: DNA-3-methyladenine glycosylase [Myxococcales bacterium FL481]
MPSPSPWDRLPQSFFARPAARVGVDLLGRYLQREPVTLRITEVEAYVWPDDTANHCRSGRTARNAAMWGPPGHVYVYLCYGIHNMLNIVTDGRDEGAAVLIRSCEFVRGDTTVVRRRGGKTGPGALTGPGKVGQALALDVQWSHHPVFRRGGLSVLRGQPPASWLVGPRVGIDFADAKDREAPLRFAVADSRFVSRAGELVAAPRTRG